MLVTTERLRELKKLRNERNICGLVRLKIGENDDPKFILLSRCLFERMEAYFAPYISKVPSLYQFLRSTQSEKLSWKSTYSEIVVLRYPRDI